MGREPAKAKLGKARYCTRAPPDASYGLARSGTGLPGLGAVSKKTSGSKQPRGFSATDEGHRIHGTALLQHLEMQVRAGGAAGGSHQRDGLAFLYGVADLHQRALVVAITSDVTVAVIDFDGAAVA